MVSSVTGTASTSALQQQAAGEAGKQAEIRTNPAPLTKNAPDKPASSSSAGKTQAVSPATQALIEKINAQAADVETKAQQTEDAKEATKLRAESALLEQQAKTLKEKSSVEASV